MRSRWILLLSLGATPAPGYDLTAYDGLFRQYARRYLPATVDWRWMRSLGWAESRFNPAAESPAGAVGLMQIMPATWDETTRRMGLARAASQRSAKYSIAVGTYYFRTLYDQWKTPRPFLDRMQLSLASYNAGLGNVLAAQRHALARGQPAVRWAEIAPHLEAITGAHHVETRTYVQRIVDHYPQPDTPAGAVRRRPVAAPAASPLPTARPAEAIVREAPVEEFAIAQWVAIALGNKAVAVAAVALMLLVLPLLWKVLDRLTPYDTAHELSQNNCAVGIVVGLTFLGGCVGVALIIALTLG